MRSGTPGVPTTTEWLNYILPPGARIGIDPVSSLLPLFDVFCSSSCAVLYFPELPFYILIMLRYHGIHQLHNVVLLYLYNFRGIFFQINLINNTHILCI